MRMICFFLFIVIAIILFSCHIIRGGYNDNYLSPLTTKYEKGISAIMIVMHHLSQNISIHGILVVMQYIGFILVAIFFFISGYGLMYGFNNKHNYLHGFFKRRIVTILVPYWIVNTISIPMPH